MPQLKFQNPEGKIITIDSPDGSTPTEQELDQLFALSTKAPQPSMLPGYQPTEKKIAGRQDVLSTFESKPLLGHLRTAMGIATPGTIAPELGKLLSGAFQRGEAAIANPLMRLQEGLKTGFPLRKPLTLPGAISRVGSDLGQEAAKGITGERLGELGDIPRRAGVPEPLSAIIGFGSMMGITNLATRGNLVRSVNKAKQFIGKKFPKIMGKDYMLNRAKLASEGLDDLYKGLSQQYDDVLNKIGNRPVNLEAMQNIVNDLPQNVINKVSKSNLIVKSADGTLQPTIRNLKTIKGILRKSVPNNVWNGRVIGDATQGSIKQAYYDVNNLMAQGNPELVALNAKYRDFMTMRDEVSRIIYDPIGEVKSKGLESLYKPGAERNKQIFFEKFANLWPQAQSIIKDSVKFAKRAGLKAGARRIAPWIPAILGGGYMGTRLLNRPNVGGFE